MATKRFGLSALASHERQPLLNTPIHQDSFSYCSAQVEDFLVNQNLDTLECLVFKYFIPIAEIEANVSSEQKSLMKMIGDSYKDPSSEVKSLLTSFFGISSETEDIGEYMIHSGSSCEELFLPPYQIRRSDAVTDIDPYESADLDIMLLIRQPLMCKYTDDVTSDNSSSVSSNVHLVMDNSGCHKGFTRILVKGDADLLLEPLKKSVIRCEEGNYLSSELFLSSFYDPLVSRLQTKEQLKKGKLTRQGPAINMKALNNDDSVESFFDIDLVPTFKCDRWPDQLLAWKKRIQLRLWPPEDIRLQMFQKPCYAVGVGYHGNLCVCDK